MESEYARCRKGLVRGYFEAARWGSLIFWCEKGDSKERPDQREGKKVSGGRLTGHGNAVILIDAQQDNLKAAPFRIGAVLRSSMDYWIRVITRCAETGRVPPASGVMVSAAAVPSGFRTVKTELITVVSTIAIPTIWDTPVARPDTV